MGCKTCWARPLVCDRLSGTMRGLPCGPAQGTDHLYAFDPTFHADRLADPLRVRKPQVIGVSFLGDLFDPKISDEQLLRVFDVLRQNEDRAQPHTMIVLTKQAERMVSFLSRLRWWSGELRNPMSWDGHLWLTARPQDTPSAEVPGSVLHRSGGHLSPLLRHVWLGVSVSSQADTHRILDLQRTPAAHRWVSYEPAIDHLWLPMAGGAHDLPQVDAVVMGGESGPGWRPMDEDWARLMRDQCARHRIAFSLKQGSGMRPEHTPGLDGVRHWNVPWMGGRA